MSYTIDAKVLSLENVKNMLSRNCRIGKVTLKTRPSRTAPSWTPWHECERAPQGEVKVILL